MVLTTCGVVWFDPGHRWSCFLRARRLLFSNTGSVTLLDGVLRETDDMWSKQIDCQSGTSSNGNGTTSVSLDRMAPGDNVRFCCNNSSLFKTFGVPFRTFASNTQCFVRNTAVFADDGTVFSAALLRS